MLKSKPQYHGLFAGHFRAYGKTPSSNFRLEWLLPDSSMLNDEILMNWALIGDSDLLTFHNTGKSQYPYIALDKAGRLRWISAIVLD